MKTFSAKPTDIKQEWPHVDGTDQTLGSKTVTKDTTNDRIVYDAADPTWTAVAGGSSPVIKKDPGKAAYTHAVFDAASK